MKLLQVLHFFLPRHSAGTEVYTDGVARALRERGHEVHLFFTDKVLSEPNYRLVRRRHKGMPCHVLINNLLYGSFAETFLNEPAERAFAQVLDEVRPDAVHFQHLMLLSMRLPEIAARRGIPALLTLHDFWLYCARFGQLMERGEKVCPGPAPRRCAACITDFKFAQSPLEKRVISAIRWTKEVAGFDLAPVVDAWRGSRLAGAARLLPRRSRAEAATSSAAAELEEGFRLRARALADMLPHLDLILSPSCTVRDLVVSFGLPAERVEVVPLGIQGIDLPGPRPSFAGRDPVFGFIGTISPHKGVHIAVEAMRYLKGRGELVIFGRPDFYPWYVSSLRPWTEKLPIRFAGSVPRGRIGEAFASIDVLVVPSIWLENYPISIQEARAARVPVVASNLGGMAEAVRHGVDGLLFQPGDAQDLARQLATLIHEPERIAAMAEQVTPPVTLEEHTSELEARLGRLVAARRGA